MLIIPDNIFLLSSLETLTLIGLAIRSLPETIKYLPRLAEFGVYDCKLLQSIPAFSHFIKSLVVWNCESLEKLSSSMGEPHEKTNPGFTMLLNCNQLDLHSYRAVLKDALGGIDLRARLSSQYEIMYLFNEYFLPDMPGREFWFHYRSTQVSFTLELPSNLFGFAYYLVISQGRVENGAYFRCECYVDDSVTITSFTRVKIIEHQYWTNLDNSIHMMSDHLVLWYDPVSCKQIMDEIKAIKDVNNSGYNPKLTFRFFIDQSETLYDEVSIKECGFRWIYQENIVPHTIFESDDEKEEIIPYTIFESSDEEEEEEEIVPRTIFEVKQPPCIKA